MARATAWLLHEVGRGHADGGAGSHEGRGGLDPPAPEASEKCSTDRRANRTGGNRVRDPRLERCMRCVSPTCDQSIERNPASHGVHRDPFEPIMCILEADSPLAEYRKITDGILKRTPDENRYPRPAAEAVRSFLLLRLGLHLGLRQKNLRQLRVCPRGHFPTSERRLEDMKCGELRWSDRDGGWKVPSPSRIPAHRFSARSRSG